MTPKELFYKLENTSNPYSYFGRGRKYVFFSTGGWSENEELICELEKELVFKLLLVEWQRGGHYKFEIPNKDLLNHDFSKKTKDLEDG